MADISPVLEVLDRYRRLLENKDMAAMGRLIQAYKQIYRRLKTLIDALVLEIGNEYPTKGQLTRMARYQQLIEQAADELRAFQVLATNETEAAGETGIAVGQRYAREVLSTIVAGDASIVGAFNRLPGEAVKTLLGFLDPAGPLYARLAELAPFVTQRVADVMVEGIGLGVNPREIARAVESAFGGGLTDALRTVRTAQIWAYREASRANFLANADVVSGWVWHAEMGPRTCMSCIAMHGTVHPLTEHLNDHYNGRCSAVPIVKGFDPVVLPGDGERWFSEQPASVQLQMMGKQKYDAWKAGKINIADFPGIHRDSVYGAMRIEKPYKELVNNRSN